MQIKPNILTVLMYVNGFWVPPIFSWFVFKLQKLSGIKLRFSNHYYQEIALRKWGISNLPELLGIYRHPVSSTKKRLNVEIFTFTLKNSTAIQDLIVPGLNNRYILKETNIESIHKVRTNKAKYTVFSVL